MTLLYFVFKKSSSRHFDLSFDSIDAVRGSFAMCHLCVCPMHLPTCLSFSRSAWYELTTKGSLGCALRGGGRGGGGLPDLLHPPPPPLRLLFLRLAHSLLPFSPNTQLLSFLMGMLSDFLTLITESMMLRDEKVTLLPLWWMVVRCWTVLSFAHDVLLWRGGGRTRILSCQAGGYNSGWDVPRTRTADRQGSDTLTGCTVSHTHTHTRLFTEITCWSKVCLLQEGELWSNHRRRDKGFQAEQVLCSFFNRFYLNSILTWFSCLFILDSFLTNASGHSWLEAHSNKSS